MSVAKATTGENTQTYRFYMVNCHMHTSVCVYVYVCVQQCASVCVCVCVSVHVFCCQGHDWRKRIDLPTSCE